MSIGVQGISQVAGPVLVWEPLAGTCQQCGCHVPRARCVMKQDRRWIRNNLRFHQFVRDGHPAVVISHAGVDVTVVGEDVFLPGVAPLRPPAPAPVPLRPPPRPPAPVPVVPVVPPPAPAPLVRPALVPPAPIAVAAGPGAVAVGPPGVGGALPGVGRRPPLGVIDHYDDNAGARNPNDPRAVRVLPGRPAVEYAPAEHVWDSEGMGQFVDPLSLVARNQRQLRPFSLQSLIAPDGDARHPRTWRHYVALRRQQMRFATGCMLCVLLPVLFLFALRPATVDDPGGLCIISGTTRWSEEVIMRTVNGSYIRCPVDAGGHVDCDFPGPCNQYMFPANIPRAWDMPSVLAIGLFHVMWWIFVWWVWPTAIRKLHNERDLLRLRGSVIVVRNLGNVQRRAVLPLAVREFAGGLLGYDIRTLPCEADYASLTLAFYTHGSMKCEMPIEFNLTACRNFLQQYTSSCETALFSDPQLYRKYITQFMEANVHLAVGDASQEYANTSLATWALVRCSAYRNFARGPLPGSPRD